MRTELTPDDVLGLLEESHLAVLATLRTDGSVLLSPVWYEWRDGGFNVWVGADDVKARHLRRDPRATLVVAEPRPPLRGIEVRGEVTLVADPTLETAIRIATRYEGAEAGADYARSMEGPQVTIRLEPGHLRVWDFADQ
jgi:PPOX class probable F420-dependent enzyme